MKKILIGIFALICTCAAETAFADSTPLYFFKDYVPYTLEHPLEESDGIIYMPAAEGAASMGISNVSYSEDGGLAFGIYDKYIYMNIGSNAVNVFGEEHVLDGAPKIINNVPYVSVKSFATMVGSPIEIQDEGTHKNIIVSTSGVLESEIVNHRYEDFINNSGIQSRTPYLVWIKKGDYKVRVFLGENGSRKLIKEFTCGIGKSSTPTCTGQYEYYSREKMWPYSGYYVGPIMRFNGGYAIHSTLLRYDGTPYDDRVGVKISHGCIRLRKDDINWMVSYIPLNTRIYINE